MPTQVDVYRQHADEASNLRSSALTDVARECACCSWSAATTAANLSARADQLVVRAADLRRQAAYFTSKRQMTTAAMIEQLAREADEAAAYARSQADRCHDSGTGHLATALAAEGHHREEIAAAVNAQAATVANARRHHRR